MTGTDASAKRSWNSRSERFEARAMRRVLARSSVSSADAAVAIAVETASEIGAHRAEIGP
jgi:hypothetical protein